MYLSFFISQHQDHRPVSIHTVGCYISLLISENLLSFIQSNFCVSKFIWIITAWVHTPTVSLHSCQLTPFSDHNLLAVVFLPWNKQTNKKAWHKTNKATHRCSSLFSFFLRTSMWKLQRKSLCPQPQVIWYHPCIITYIISPFSNFKRIQIRVLYQ